jgi:hypothetical protein
MLLSLLLCGCETWYSTLKEERKLRVFENRVLRIFGHKRQKSSGGWRKSHNEEFYNLYASPHNVKAIKSRRITWET